MSTYSNPPPVRNRSRAAALATAIVDSTNLTTGDAFRSWYRGDVVNLREMRVAEIEAALDLVREYEAELAADLLREIRPKDD